MSVHDGHRARVRAKLIDHGPESFHDHEIMEALLFYANARGDTNPLAHRLIDTFGSLNNALDAPIEQLTRVEGVGECTAVLLKLVREMSRRYMKNGVTLRKAIYTSQEAYEYLRPRFFREREEMICLLCLNIKKQIIDLTVLTRGGAGYAATDVRTIAKTALEKDAAYVILAHNHPDGASLPSSEDMNATQVVESSLRSVGVRLQDHIILGENDYFSFADNGKLED